MAITVQSVDLAGRARAFIPWRTVSITPVLNGVSTARCSVPTEADEAAELMIAQRGLKVYQDGALRFLGPIWEPFTINHENVQAEARDPLAYLSERVVRTQTTYTAQDAGAIAMARITAQDALGDVKLAQGTIQASANRDRTYDPGKNELEIIQELGSVINGIWFYVTPLDASANWGSFQVRYPDSGTTQADVRFEYGTDTLHNCTAYEVIDSLPLNRVVAVSADASGLRIAEPATDDTSQATYGLFEKEASFADVTVATTLQQHAQGLVRATPPRSFKLTPGPDAPLLYRDFMVGDFVRVAIKHGPLNVEAWARVWQATLTAHVDGGEQTTDIVLEVVA